jgi:hypothetical protein
MTLKGEIASQKTLAMTLKGEIASQKTLAMTPRRIWVIAARALRGTMTRYRITRGT